MTVISKLAALHVQEFSDPVTLSAVNDIEDLTQGLSRKIWQKIMILDRILARLTFPGALYLAAVAALPTIIIASTNAPSSFYFGGTSLLIVVGVALDTMKQLEAQLMMRNYEGFLK